MRLSHGVSSGAERAQPGVRSVRGLRLRVETGESGKEIVRRRVVPGLGWTRGGPHLEYGASPVFPCGVLRRAVGKTDSRTGRRGVGLGRAICVAFADARQVWQANVGWRREVKRSPTGIRGVGGTTTLGSRWRGNPGLWKSSPSGNVPVGVVGGPGGRLFEGEQPAGGHGGPGSRDAVGGPSRRSLLFGCPAGGQTWRFIPTGWVDTSLKGMLIPARGCHLRSLPRVARAKKRKILKGLLGRAAGEFAGRIPCDALEVNPKRFRLFVGDLETREPHACSRRQ